MTRWTPAEDATLREVYVPHGPEATHEALPHRTLTAIFKRASRLGVSYRNWDELEDQRLRFFWDAHFSLADIAAKLGRTEGAIYQRAQVLELGLGVPKGWETMTHAAKRTGFTTYTLRRILRWARVHVRKTLSHPAMKPKYKFRIAEVSAIDEAVEAWLCTESALAAARRLGISGKLLVRRLEQAGIKRQPGERYFRVTEAEVRRAMEAA